MQRLAITLSAFLIIVVMIINLALFRQNTQLRSRLVAPQPTVAAASAEQRTAATTISLKTLEERYGVRLRLLAVTALGGMVDLRYVITDHTKATALAQYLGQIELVDDNSGTTLKMATGHGMHRNDRIEDGQLNFHFFANAGNAIKQGNPVTVVIGPVRLEAIDSQ